jgi:hypothetical protein
MEETSITVIDIDGRDRSRGIAIGGRETFERQRCVCMRR